jgi:predicted dehydrogenase
MDKKKILKPLYEYSIHYLDIIQALFGLPEVKHTELFKHKHIKFKYHDTVRSLLQYKEGISGSLFFTLAAEPSNLGTQLSVIGSEGSLAVDFRENIINGEFLDEDKQKTFEKLKKEVKEDNLFSSLYKALAKGNAPTVKSAILVTDFIEQVYSKEQK